MVRRRAMQFTDGILPLQIMTETQPIAVAVFDVKIAATVRLVANRAYYLRPGCLELSIERVSIIDPDIAVPRPAFRVDDVIGAHPTRGFVLREHDHDATPLDHAKRGWIVPEALVMKAELITIVVCRPDDIVYNEVGSDTPAVAVRDLFGHSVCAVRPKRE